MTPVTIVAVCAAVRGSRPLRKLRSFGTADDVDGTWAPDRGRAQLAAAAPDRLPGCRARGPHYWFHKLAKNDIADPAFYAVILGLLLGARLAHWTRSRARE